MKISKLRRQGFRIVKLTGNQTMLSHDNLFTVFGIKASDKGHQYSFIISGHYQKEIPRDIVLIK